MIFFCYVYKEKNKPIRATNDATSLIVGHYKSINRISFIIKLNVETRNLINIYESFYANLIILVYL